jgi:hypothetical protein
MVSSKPATLRFFVTFDERTAMFDEDLGDWISVGIYDAQS